MDREKLLHYVAPCSLLCYTCLGLKDGAFAEYAPKLSAYCEGVCEFITQNSSEEEREKTRLFFAGFHDTLSRLGGGECYGCRNDLSLKGGCIEGCVIPDCAKEREVDYCAECGEFPCQKAKVFFDTHSDKICRIWEAGSRRIKEVGIEEYFEEKKGMSHYLHYKE